MPAALAARSEPGGVSAVISARTARRQRTPRTTRSRRARSSGTIVSKGVRTRRSIPRCGDVMPQSVTTWQPSYARTPTIRQRARRTYTTSPGRPGCPASAGFDGGICIAHRPLACGTCRAGFTGCLKPGSYGRRADVAPRSGNGDANPLVLRQALDGRVHSNVGGTKWKRTSESEFAAISGVDVSYPETPRDFQPERSPLYGIS